MQIHQAHVVYNMCIYIYIYIYINMQLYTRILYMYIYLYILRTPMPAEEPNAEFKLLAASIRHKRQQQKIYTCKQINIYNKYRYRYKYRYQYRYKYRYYVYIYRRSLCLWSSAASCRFTLMDSTVVSVFGSGSWPMCTDGI